jgi:DTW domain-containing protein YfiP
MTPTDEPRDTLATRAVCYRCHKPQLTCICRQLPRVFNRTWIWVAQHPRERFHPIGTARIAQLALDRVHLEVLRGASDAPPPTLPARAGLLYPDPTARDLATLRRDERLEALVVIDGTWAQARTLHRDHRWLQRLPHFRLTPQHESRYRLRKEPAPMCVSTIEAIVEALRLLEPSTLGIDELLASFDAMIDQQLALIRQHRCGRRRRDAPRSLHGIPYWSLDELDRVVAVALEAAPHSDAGRDRLAIVQCVALRIGTGETFQHFVRPPVGRFPGARHLHYMGLDAALLQSGTSPEELRAAWRRFVTPADIVVAWGNGVLDILESAVGLPDRRVQLKSAYRSHAKHARGPLHAQLQRLQLEPRTLPALCGRAGRHLAEVAALLAHLRRADDGPPGPCRSSAPPMAVPDPTGGSVVTRGR